MLQYALNRIADKVIVVNVEIINENINNLIQLNIRHLCLQNPSKQKQRFITKSFFSSSVSM
jgi:hypothetical protein